MPGRTLKWRITLIWENTLLAFESLWDRRFRSMLTILGVFIGVVIVIAAVVYAAMVLLVLWFWSEPPAPFRYTET